MVIYFYSRELAAHARPFCPLSSCIVFSITKIYCFYLREIIANLRVLSHFSLLLYNVRIKIMEKFYGTIWRLAFGTPTRQGNDTRGACKNSICVNWYDFKLRK